MQCRQRSQTPHVLDYCQTWADARTVKPISVKSHEKVRSRSDWDTGKQSIKPISVVKELPKEFDNVQVSQNIVEDSHGTSFL